MTVWVSRHCELRSDSWGVRATKMSSKVQHFTLDFSPKLEYLRQSIQSSFEALPQIFVRYLTRTGEARLIESPLFWWSVVGDVKWFLTKCNGFFLSMFTYQGLISCFPTSVTFLDRRRSTIHWSWLDDQLIHWSSVNGHYIVLSDLFRTHFRGRTISDRFSFLRDWFFQ